jgi:uncharacterized membrane protein YgcG
MNEDWMTELEPRAGVELERQLDRYVRVRLDPGPAQAKRARSAVMEAAWRQRIGAPAAAPASAPSRLDEPSVTAASMTMLASPARAATHSRSLFGGWGARRLGVSFAAAVLAGLMLGTSAFAASRAGGPLYDVRLGLEQLTLPVDAQARLEAELALAQGRLADIVEATSKDDPGAIAAAVRAYLITLADLAETHGGPADRALLAIQAHRAVLLRVLGEVPEQAQGGIENAIAQSSMVIERLDAAATPAVGGSGSGGSGGAGSGTGGTGGTGGSGGGAGNGGAAGTGSGAGNKPADPEPARTPKPARTPAPTARPERPAPVAPEKGTQGKP